MRGAIVLYLCIAGAAFSATPDQEAALREITAFTAAQQRSDPLYRTVEEELLQVVDDVIKSKPSNEWAPTIKRLYFTFSERAHAEEQAAARVVEAQAIAKGPRDPVDAWIARSAALDAEMRGGKLGPREHAVRALAAVRLLYPADGLLIALRETKLALATEYELGNITRAQYDERWSLAKVNYEKNAASRERAIMDEMRAEQAAIAAQPRRPTIGELMRQQQGITCRSVPGPLGTTTTCR